MNIGIIGTGYIALKMIETIKALNDDLFVFHSILSRDLLKAKKIGIEYNALYFDDLNSFLNDSDLDLVYIATPNDSHYYYSKQALLKNKHVLCEKPFTMHFLESLDLIDIARKNKLFINEAMWTRFMPFNKLLKDLLDKEKINDIKAVFNLNIIDRERIASYKMGGGALYDLGVYPLSFFFSLFGSDYSNIEINKIIYNSDNVDLFDDVTIYYKDIACRCICAVDRDVENYIEITTFDKIIYLDSTNCPTYIKIFDKNKHLIEKYDTTPSINGYEYQLFEAAKSLMDRKLEIDKWNHSNSIDLISLIERIKELSLS